MVVDCYRGRKRSAVPAKHIWYSDRHKSLLCAPLLSFSLFLSLHHSYARHPHNNPTRLLSTSIKYSFSASQCTSSPSNSFSSACTSREQLNFERWQRCSSWGSAIQFFQFYHHRHNHHIPSPRVLLSPLVFLLPLIQL